MAARERSTPALEAAHHCRSGGRARSREADPLPVDLLMVSHVDDDHIHGILDLTGELLRDKAAHGRCSLQVSSFWHNSFDNRSATGPTS